MQKNMNTSDVMPSRKGRHQKEHLPVRRATLNANFRLMDGQAFLVQNTIFQRVRVTSCSFLSILNFNFTCPYSLRFFILGLQPCDKVAMLVFNTINNFWKYLHENGAVPRGEKPFRSWSPSTSPLWRLVYTSNILVLVSIYFLFSVAGTTYLKVLFILTSIYFISAQSVSSLRE